MKNISSVKEGVLSLLEKNRIQCTQEWEYLPKSESDLTAGLKVDGETYPLLYWRSDPQIDAVQRNARFNIGGSVSMKASGMVERSYGLDAFLYKELDIAEWVLDSEIQKITAFANNNAMNLILVMKNEKVAVLELGATLPDGTEEQTRHTAWGKQGLESTRVVSTKVRPQSVYLFTDRSNPYTFNDTTFELFGLKLEDATLAVAIFKVLSGKTDLKYVQERDSKLRFYMQKVFESAERQESVLLGGGEND